MSGGYGRLAYAFALAGASLACGTGSVAHTYEEDVAPILARQCLGCHRTGGIAPFALGSYTEARAHAAAIADSTATRRMPPFLIDNSGACNTFVDTPWLTEREIETIGRWVELGAPRGEPSAAQSQAEVAAPPGGEEAPAPPPPIVVGATLDPETDYQPREELGDDYRCFLVDPGNTEDRFLTGYEVVPGDPSIVHHVILYSIDDDGGMSRAVQLDAEEPGPGYTCFGTSGLSIQSSRAVAAWAPGTAATRYPAGTGIRLHGGRRAIMQVHYNTENGVGPDRTRIHLELAPAVDRPAEILAVADLALNAPGGQDRYLTEPIRITPGVGGFVHGVYPHMHKLGRELHARVVHTDESSNCLAEVPAWDFSWQRFYFLDRPQYVLGSDRIELSCAYDTRGRAEPVRWGEGTGDEMCLLGLYVTLN